MFRLARSLPAGAAPAAPRDEREHAHELYPVHGVATTSSAMYWNGGRSTMYLPPAKRPGTTRLVTASTARGFVTGPAGPHATRTPRADSGLSLTGSPGFIGTVSCTQSNAFVTATTSRPGFRWATAYRPGGPPLTMTGAVRRCGASAARKAAAAAAVRDGSLHGHRSLAIVAPPRLANASTCRRWPSVSSLGLGRTSSL